MPKGVPTEVDRPRSIRVPVTDDELWMAKQLAAAARMDLAPWLRSLIKQAARSSSLADPMLGKVDTMISKRGKR